MPGRRKSVRFLHRVRRMRRTVSLGARSGREKTAFAAAAGGMQPAGIPSPQKAARYCALSGLMHAGRFTPGFPRAAIRLDAAGWRERRFLGASAGSSGNPNGSDAGGKGNPTLLGFTGGLDRAFLSARQKQAGFATGFEGRRGRDAVQWGRFHL